MIVILGKATNYGVIAEAEGHVTKGKAFRGNKQLSSGTAKCVETDFDNAPVNLEVLLNVPRMQEQMMS